MVTLYVKKLSSLSPNKYWFITLNKAIKDYNIWCSILIKNWCLIYKSLEEWIATEI